MTIATAWQWYLKCVDGCGAEAGCECMGPDNKPALVVCDDRVLHIPKVSERPPDSRCSPTSSAVNAPVDGRCLLGKC